MWKCPKCQETIEENDVVTCWNCGFDKLDGIVDSVEKPNSISKTETSIDSNVDIENDPIRQLCLRNRFPRSLNEYFSLMASNKLTLFVTILITGLVILSLFLSFDVMSKSITHSKLSHVNVFGKNSPTIFYFILFALFYYPIPYIIHNYSIVLLYGMKKGVLLRGMVSFGIILFLSSKDDYINYSLRVVVLGFVYFLILIFIMNGLGL